MTPSISANAILTDLHAVGIDVQVYGGALRFQPRHAMTPELLQRLQANKVELLTFLDTNRAVADLRRYVAGLWQDHSWRSAWEHRFREAKYANLDSLRRVLNIVIDLAQEHHCKRDWTAFYSACKYLRRLAHGKEWDNAKPFKDFNRWNTNT